MVSVQDPVALYLIAFGGLLLAAVLLAPLPRLVAPERLVLLLEAQRLGEDLEERDEGDREVQRDAPGHRGHHLRHEARLTPPGQETPARVLGDG